jgi:hypothetical protein
MEYFMLINLATTKLVINLTFVIKLPARGAVGRLVGMLDDATVVGLAVGLNDGTVVGRLFGSCDGTGVYRTSAEEDHSKVNT